MRSTLLLAIIATGACAGRPSAEPRGPGEAASPAETDSQSPPPVAGAAETPFRDFGPVTDAQVAAVESALHDDEVEEATVAEAGAAHVRVRDFATGLRAGHSEAKVRQERLLERLGIVPAECRASALVRRDAERTLGSFRFVSAAAFDDAFMDSQVDAQYWMLRIIQEELIPNARNPDLKAALGELVPLVTADVHEALDIQRELAEAPGPLTLGE